MASTTTTPSSSGFSWSSLLPYLITGGIGLTGAVIGSKATGSAAKTAADASSEAARINADASKQIAAMQQQSDYQNQKTLRDILALQLGMEWPKYRLGMESAGRLATGMGSKLDSGVFNTTDQPPQLPPLDAPGAAASTGGPSDAGAAPGAGASPGALNSDLGLQMLGLQPKPGALKSSLTGAAGMAGTGASIGSFGGPIGTAIGAGVGALVGGISGLIGKGRKEADQIVPYQNALNDEFTKVRDYLYSHASDGTLTKDQYTQAMGYLDSLFNDFNTLTDKFGRAGPQAKQTIAQYLTPQYNDLKNLPNLFEGDNASASWAVPGKAHGGAVSGGKYIVGEKGPEVLEMAPGSEGWVYPHGSSVERRAAGGEVDGGHWIQGAIKHPGAFTAQAKRAHMGTQEFAGYVGSHPSKFSATTERRANLAQILSKMHRANGGAVCGPMIHRATGGPVTGGILPQYQGQDIAALQAQGINPYTGSTNDVSKPWAQMSPESREWVINRASANPAEFSLMTNPDGSVRAMTPDEATQYGQFQQTGLENGDLFGKKFTPAASPDIYRRQVEQWANGGSGVSPDKYNATQALDTHPTPGSPTMHPLPPRTASPAGTQQIQSDSMAPGPDITGAFTPDNNSPMASAAANPASTAGGQFPYGHDQNQISQWGWTDLGNGQWMHPESGATGHWLSDTIFVNEQAGKMYNMATGQVTDLPQGGYSAPGNPYADMQAPYDTYPGEFMQPWQANFGFDPTTAGYMPFNSQFSFDPSQIASDPAYQFLLNEGNKAVERSASARGMLNSGRTLKDLLRFSQGLASQEYGNSYNRALQQFGVNYGQTTDAYNRALNEYNLARQIFEDNQNKRYTRLTDLVNMGLT